MTDQNKDEQSTRFKIVDSEKDKRLRICWRDAEGKQREKEFSYKMKPKADQMKVAEEYRAELIRTVKKKEWKPRSFGSVLKEYPAGGAPRWVFTCTLETGKHTKSFSVKKYGDVEAFLLAKEAQWKVFPESMK